jgi:hypothetical protein
MKKAAYIFGIMKKYLHSKEFLEKCRKGPKNFLRVRLLPHTVIFSFILNLLNDSIPKEANCFCKIGKISTTSRAAITKARSKLAPHAFVAMNDILIEEFYSDNPVKTFHGLIPVGVDGSVINLPINSPEIAEKYGCISNQTDHKIPAGRISQLYDVVNGISLEAIIAPYATAERELAIRHIEKIKNLKIDILDKIITIFDRGYPSLPLIVYLLKNKIHFLMRSNSRFLKEVNDVVLSGKRDSIVNISLRRSSTAAKKELKVLFPQLDMEETITFRVLIVTLSTGEQEILLTSLIDKKRYPYKIFKEFYFKRWGIEEQYKFYKAELELENFSGMTCHAVEQDFHATVLAGNARALLAIESERELGLDENIRQKKYDYKVNKNVSMGKLKNEFVFILLNHHSSIEDFCNETKKIMKRNLIPIRPGRTFKRKRKHPHRKYFMNTR